LKRELTPLTNCHTSLTQSQTLFDSVSTRFLDKIPPTSWRSDKFALSPGFGCALVENRALHLSAIEFQPKKRDKKYPNL